MKQIKTIHLKTLAAMMLAACVCGSISHAQNIAWVGPTVISGDANLVTNGTYYDAIIPLAPASLTADGVTFNAPTGTDTDGKISYTVTSGSDQRYDNNSLFTGGSSAFNAIMNAGGTYETGGAGAGTVTISGLTPGDSYSIQVFNYAGDGDAGLTTLSGSSPVTLTTTGSGASGGSFATGTFTATGATETFNWKGAGSSYTVLGAISVRKQPLTPTISPTNRVTAGTVVTLAVVAQAGQTYYQWQTDNGSGGVNWSNLAGANNTNYVLNTTGFAAGNYEFEVIVTNASLNLTSAPVTLTVFAPPAQGIVWGAATGITGDANLSTAGTYFDALMTDSSVSPALAVDGISFNPASSIGGGAFGDGKISYSGSGLNNFSWPASFPTSAPASSAFATLMDDGGIFQNGGSGTGTVTISGLTPGHEYSVQVFNYAPDGDAGLTTLSGATPVTLSNLPGAAGVNTYGEFATGSFSATTTAELFNWNGAGSSYTVLGAISVRDTSAAAVISPTNVVYQGNTVTLMVNAQPGPTSYQWQTDGGSGGVSWSNLAGANNTNYVLNTGSLAAGNYEFQVIVTNSTLDITSPPVSLTVLVPSAPVIWENVTPPSASVYVGQSVSFAAAFTGNQPITNQWQVSQDGGNTFSNLAGETNSVLTLTNLQSANAGEYRLAAGNAFGSNDTTSAVLTVNPWSAAQIQWSAPVSIAGLSAGQVLTNVSGAYLEAAVFFYDSFITVTAGNQQYVFRSDGASASISNGAYYGGQFVTNAIHGSGALGTNSTGDARFDGVLNQYYDGGVSNMITLNNLIAGQQYAVQLFALDNRSGTASELVDFANAVDANDVSSQFMMGDNASLIGTFTATNTYQTIQENLLTGGFGNINAVVVRALSYTPGVKPVIVVQPRQRTSLLTRTATFTVVADGAPSPNYQWQAGPVGGPYTNVVDGGRFAGTMTATLTVNDVGTNDTLEFVVGITNAAGGLTSAPVDLIDPAVGQPVASARPIRITCVGASDVSSPTPYGTPNWPVYIAPMLGYEYAITNCGASGTTMIQNGNAPYWNTQQYTDGLNSSPDIVIIMLGSNDSKPYNWIYQTNYTPDYEELISQYRNLPSHPRIYLNTLLKVYGAGNYDILGPIVDGQLCPIIKQIALDEGLPVIDVNTATENMPQNFPDNIHPDIAGAKVVAQTVFNGLISAGETAPMIDRALNQPVLASSVANGNVAANAVDADYTTLWQSAPSNNQWIYVDLGSALNVTGVYLNWGPDYGQSYKIQISNDAINWTDVYTNNAGSGGIDRINVAVSGRYVRMLGLTSGTGNGYDLLDFTVTVAAPPTSLNINRASQVGFNLSWPVSSTSFGLE
ncbi:MAG TPA: discoidin domain-containing protein, partial [Candidatus Acidoferrum sp.]|nr:discoidin domain-containing protein [Candidatus Acidoferrum sp.]